MMLELWGRKNAYNVQKVTWMLAELGLESQPYLAGESFTMSDIPCAVGLYRYFNMGLDVDRPEHVLLWYQRLSQRSAFAGTIMTPFDALEGRIDY